MKLVMSQFRHNHYFKMKRSPLKRIGRVGRANMEANRILREKLGHITSCEIKLDGCLGSFTLANVHRHKRLFYKGDAERLSDTRQVVRGCQNCHDKIEHNKELTEAVFMKLRGLEN